MEIRQITEQNPWWQDEKAILKDEKIQEALSRQHSLIPDKFQNNNFLLIGPRQVGKTTYLKLIIKQLIDQKINPKTIVYFSCEPLRRFEEIIEIVRFADSLISGPKYFFFDEITFVPDWQRAIKYILDSQLKKQKTFYITGSSSIALKKETFPGRDIQIKNFLPLSFKQFCQLFVSQNLKLESDSLKLNNASIADVYKKIKHISFYFSEISDLFAKYIQCGGFPKSIYELMEGKGISEQTHEIYWQWLISDIAKIERSERITRAILIAMLKNYGSRFSLNSVAKEMEIGSHVTIREYLEILEDLFVLRNVFPFDAKKKVEVFRKMRKVYFIDPFLFAVFKKVLTKQSVEEKEISAIIEGIVSEHLKRSCDRIFYHSGKKEVDFVLNNKTGLEVKWQNKVNFSDFPSIEFANKIILSKSDFDFNKKQNILIAPVSLFLLLCG